jgi:glutathione S-transferase
MLNPLGHLWSATATILMVAFYFFSVIRVGALRGRLGIKAPACTGDPAFERAFRVQMNTLEQLAIVLPLLWVATLYPMIAGWLPGLIGLIWVAGRIVFMRAYLINPDTRLTGMLIGALCNFALLGLAATGVISAWIFVPR